MLELSGNSGVALGIVTGLQFLPVLLLGMWAGRARRPLRQAPPDHRRAGGDGRARARPRAARRHRPGAAVARVRAVGRARHRLRARHPGAAVVHGRARRAGRPAQRGQPQQRHLQLGAHRRPGRRGRARSPRSAPAGSSWPTPCRSSPCSPGCSPMRRDELSTPRRVAKAKGQVREGLAYVRRAPRPARRRRARVDDRHLRPELPDHHGAGGQGGLRQGRGLVRAADLDAGRRLAARGARQRAPLRAAARAAPAAVGAGLRGARGARRAGAQLRRHVRAARADRRRGADLHHHRQHAAAARQRAARARPGHGAVRPGLPRRHPARRPAHRRGRRAARPALGPAHRRASSALRRRPSRRRCTCCTCAALRLEPHLLRRRPHVHVRV